MPSPNYIVKKGDTLWHSKAGQPKIELSPSQLCTLTKVLGSVLSLTMLLLDVAN